jgi:hypothetical protein
LSTHSESLRLVIGEWHVARGLPWVEEGKPFQNGALCHDRECQFRNLHEVKQTIQKARSFSNFASESFKQWDCPNDEEPVSSITRRKESDEPIRTVKTFRNQSEVITNETFTPGCLRWRLERNIIPDSSPQDNIPLYEVLLQNIEIQSGQGQSLHILDCPDE